MAAKPLAPRSLEDNHRPLRVAMTGNGATVHALVRGGAIASLGHTVRLFTLGPVLPVPHPALEISTRPLPKNPWQGLSAFRSFQRDLRDFQPDLLHVHYAGGRLGSLALASGLRPLVVTVMGGDVQPEQHLGRATAVDHRTTARLLQEADLILAKSAALTQDIAKYGDYSKKTEIVRWGIEAARFRRNPSLGAMARERLDLPEGPILLSPRILRPLYNVHLIVEAMPTILRTTPDANLVISRHREDPAYATQIQARVHELGIGNRVRFVAPISYDEMPSVLSATSVVISVPFSDGLPQTLFECLASETPIVMGRLAAYEEMVKDGREVVMTELTPEGIARAVSRILGDGKLIKQLTIAGLERLMEQASLPDEARRVDGFYRRILSGEHRRSPLVPRILDAVSLGLPRG